MQVLRWYFLLLLCWWIFLMPVTVSVAIMQLEVSAAHMQVSFCSKLVGDKFYCNYADWAFFDHFWSFLLDGDFLQKICLCHTQLYLEPQHHAKFKTNEPIQRKLTERQKDGRKDGWKDGQTLFYRILPAIFKKNVLTDSSHLFKKGMQFLSKKRNYKTFARLFLHCYFMYLIVYYSIYKQYSPT